MKKFFLASLLLLVAGIQTALAQFAIVSMADGRTVVYDVSEVDSISFSDVTFVDGRGCVDLGLPSGTLWATCNVGADTPQDYGQYFAWGELQPKNTYNWGTYIYCNNTATTMTKYCSDSSYGLDGFTDNLTELESRDDVATASWGTNWQMPSFAQFRELLDEENTTTTWTTCEGVYGRLIRSKRYGSSIFLPATGYYYDSSLSSVGVGGNYWSRTSSYGNSAYAMYLTERGMGTDFRMRSFGYTVRPVFKPYVPVSGIILSRTELNLDWEYGDTLRAIVLPEDASVTDVTWESSNERVVRVHPLEDNVVQVEALYPGTCTITCRATDGSGAYAECQVTVEKLHDVVDGHVWVDLELPSGTLWASCNLGANSPEDVGYHFAWGETAPKNDYTIDTYKYHDGSSYTKYNKTDGMTELLPEDDAAIAQWGSLWLTPSIAQLQELYNSEYTTTEWASINGRTGRLITSKQNGKSIFLPAAGYYDGTTLAILNGYGYYLSRSLYSDSWGYHYGDAAYLGFYEGDIGMKNQYRHYGRSVRPVFNKAMFEHPYAEIGGLKWATMNVGATTVAGDYATCGGNDFGYASACSAAYTEWGGSWRTPTTYEFGTLAAACTGSNGPQTPVELTSPITSGGIYWLSATQTVEPTYSGVAGLLFVSATDTTQRVFFPASSSGNGYYWSSTPDESYENYAYYMWFKASRLYPSVGDSQGRMFKVRPVSN